MTFSPFQPDASLYCMVLNNPSERSLEVGSLGTIHWPEGWTYYVGRARYGWSSRLKRFVKPDSSHHWHIDHLAFEPDVELTHLLPFTESVQRECDLAAWFSNRNSLRRLQKDFGSSDCDSDCKGHGFVTDRTPGSLTSALRKSTFRIRGYVQMTPNECRWNRILI